MKRVIMDKLGIADKINEMKSIVDLVAILNRIKQEEFHISSYPITIQELYNFSNPKKSKARYRTFKIKKKSGGSREINAPTYKLSLLLKALNVMFKAIYTPSESAMGFAEGKSVAANAAKHVGHNYVLNIDLENFFPSIPQARVCARLKIRPFNFPEEIARVIAGICCAPNEEHSRNVLPQGAPTSPLLSNAICDKLDRRMRGVAKRFGLHYSRYADDMTFSSMHNVYQEGSPFMEEIKRLVQTEGFSMNEHKTRLLRTNQRQEVTGLTVNACVNLTRKYMHDLRRYIYVWEKNGYARAYAYFYKHYKVEKGYIKKGEPVMENVIGGKLNYLRMVKGADNPAYMKLQKRYDALQQIVYVDTDTDKNEKYIYVQSYKLSEFEKLFHTAISLVYTKSHNLIGHCTLFGKEKNIKISKSTAEFLNEQLKTMALEKIAEQNFFADFYVTLRRRKGKNEWMITRFSLRRSSCLSLQDAHVDIDALLDLWEKKGIVAAAEALDKNVYGKDAVGAYKPEQNSSEADAHVVELKYGPDSGSDMEKTEDSYQSLLKEIESFQNDACADGEIIYSF